jgi:hypothetical protein
MTIVLRSPDPREVIEEVKSIRTDYEASVAILNTVLTRIKQFPLNACRKDGAWKDGVDDSPGSGLLGLTDTVGAPLLGNACSGNTKSDYAGLQFALPADYLTSGTLTVVVRAKVADTLLTASAKVDVEAKFIGDAGVGSDVCTTAAQQVTIAYADYSFTITSTGMSAGMPLALRLGLLADDTGGTVNKAMSIVEVTLRYQAYGNTAGL